jgi:DNA-directed RNA polymerase specialized sigma24 family protein
LARKNIRRTVQFPTTRWDELAMASLDGDVAARRALDDFCRRYWAPVNTFVRQKGYSDAEAADLTQDFFLNFISTRSWRRADPQQGKFRTFLLGALVHRLAKAHAHDGRLKRGGGTEIVGIDDVTAASASEADMPTVAPAEAELFDREWALGILAAALAEVRADYAARDKQRHYEALKCFLSAQGTAPAYETVADELGIPLAAVKTEIFRLRQVFRAVLHREIGRTVTDPRQVQDELRYLRNVLASQMSEWRGAGET